MTWGLEFGVGGIPFLDAFECALDLVEAPWPVLLIVLPSSGFGVWGLAGSGSRIWDLGLQGSMGSRFCAPAVGLSHPSVSL